MPRESNTRGPVSFTRFPHMVGVLDAFDDPLVERITLQWGARLGKTFLSHIIMAKVLATDPYSCVFADSTQPALIRVFERFWDLLETTLPEIVPPRHERKNDHIRTSVAQIYGAWVGAPSTAADIPAKYVIKNEADKMVSASTRLEADFRKAIDNRSHGFVGRKILTISTPSLKGYSYVENERLVGNNCRRMVPCPACGHFQELKTGNGKLPGGLKGLRNSEGKIDPDYAAKCSYYECEQCLVHIVEQQRATMCQSGLWVPEGCEVYAGKVVGTPLRSVSHSSYGPLGQLHSFLPGVSFQSEAKEWASALVAPNRSEACRSYLNEHAGEVYDPAPPLQSPDALGLRMGVSDPLRICPAWTRFLTMGADVSALGDDEYQFHWWVSAWGRGGRGQLVDFGTEFRRESMRKLITDGRWACPSRLGHFRLARCLIDSSYFTTAMYEFCDSMKKLPTIVTPIKGSSSAEKNRKDDFPANEAGHLLSKGAFRGGKLTPAKRRLLELQGKWDLILVNTHLSQQWCEDRLYGRIKPEEPTWFSVPDSVFSDSEIQRVNLPKHMLGDYLFEGRWLKRQDRQHYRDSWRYSRVAADMHTKDGMQWDTVGDQIRPDSAVTSAETGPIGPRGISGLGNSSFIGSAR